MPKCDLLARVTDHLADAGVGDRSLRQIAEGTGTSHRMLIYHFGSRAGLLADVVREVERRQREALADLLDTDGSPRDLAVAFWHRLADPALAPSERLFFELYGAALTGDPAARPVLENVVASWLPLLERLFPDVPPARRAPRARMTVAFARGALLDLLATGDRAALDAAVTEFIDTYFPDA
jgi:AcrR family transcriptional regulator